ncbi:MAG: thermonuclease family protein [Nitrospinota bacterium]|nr:thermonuclease family protein [Nitrospinota bacterium]
MTNKSKRRWRPFLSVFIAQTMIWQTALLTGAIPTRSAWAAKESLKGQVVEVLDGNTIKVRTSQGDRTIRLAGLEVEGQDKAVGKQARDTLTRVLMGREVTVQGITPNLAAGRLRATDSRQLEAVDRVRNGSMGHARKSLGHGNEGLFDGRVLLDGQDIASILLAAGLAWLLYNFLDDQLTQTQEKARLQKHGVWSSAKWEEEYFRKYGSAGQKSGWKSEKGASETSYGTVGVKSHSSGATQGSKEFRKDSKEFKKSESGNKVKSFEKEDQGLHKGWEKQR